jgi:hypothetical protein
MNIVFSQAQADQLRDRFTVLEVDSIRTGDTVTACYCVLDANSVDLTELPQLEARVHMHETLIREYRNRNWQFCRELIPLLQGSFRGTLDSFYQDMSARLDQLSEIEPEDSWHWAITAN